jgi:hypothetical protein
MLKTLSVRSCFVSPITALLVCAACNLNAQVASENYASLLSAYLGQGSANGSQAVKNNSCVPTSTANGLSFLEFYQISVGNPDPFAFSPNTIATVNSLQTLMGTTAAGTTAAGAISGLNTYLSSPTGDPAPSVVTSQTFNPSALFLGNALSLNNAVQLGILWGSITGGTFTPVNGGGGHFVSLTAMNLLGGAGTMTILDPWGNVSGNNAGTEGDFVSLNVSTVNLNGVGAVLQVTWTTNAPEDTTAIDGTGPTSFGGPGATGYIAVDDLEAVPEPATMALMGAGALAVLARRRCKA